MSYTFAICNAELPADIEAADEEVIRLREEPEPNPAVFNELIDKLTAKYPCICDLPDDKVDEGVWSDGPLRPRSYHRAIVLGLSRKIEKVMPFVIKTATGLGLTVLDWQTGEIHRPKARRAKRS
jgi:hypothetical protein